MRLGDLASAERIAESVTAVPDQDRHQYILFHSIRGLIAALRGDVAGARDQIDQTVRHKKSFGHYHHAQYDIACIYALLGEKDRALDWLTDSARNGFPCHSLFERDPYLDAIRGERFDALITALKTECDGYRRLHRELTTSGAVDSGPGKSGPRPGN
jgi:hypothetical protein